MQRSHHTSRQPLLRAFTLTEVLFTIVILSVLLGLLIVGIRHVRGFARGAVEASAVEAVMTGVQEFRSEFGFLPPLVKDQSVAPAMVVLSTPGRNTINIVQRATPADLALLNTLEDPDPDNLFANEVRFSDRSLSYYLVGALDEPHSATAALPMDGVVGPGFYRPGRGGTFDVPADLLFNSDLRRGRVYEPLVPLSPGRLLLTTSPTDLREVRLVDRNNAPIRYYRWINGQPDPQSPGGFKIEDLGDLRIPRLVGRNLAPLPGGTGVYDTFSADFRTPPERNVDTNPRLRSATWALVSAGPNGVFGDEPIEQIAHALGRGVPNSAETGTIRLLREEAESDNIVRLGDDL